MISSIMRYLVGDIPISLAACLSSCVIFCVNTDDFDTFAGFDTQTGSKDFRTHGNGSPGSSEAAVNSRIEAACLPPIGQGDLKIVPLFRKRKIETGNFCSHKGIFEIIFVIPDDPGRIDPNQCAAIFFEPFFVDCMWTSIQDFYFISGANNATF